jgi:EAL domain-containing protein (putative c-di-GMP-specific phosphodiesterase class I)/PleD family two-component response regulator
MNDHDGSRLADRHNTFLRQLPERAEVIHRRLNRFARSGWDINGLSLIHSDACRLGDRSVAHGLDEAVEPLREIAGLIEGALDQELLPDRELGERLCALAQSLRDLLPAMPAESESESESTIIEEIVLSTPGEAVAPVSDPVPAHAVAETSARPEDDVDVWGDGVALFAPSQSKQAKPADQAPSSRPEKADKPSQPGKPSKTEAPAEKPRAAAAVTAPSALPLPSGDNRALIVPADFRIYHLTGYGALSLELDQMIEAHGLEIELLEDVAELNELLSALPADLVLIDACFSQELESIGATVRLARANNNKQRLLLVAITEADDISLRLSARRAGVDALIVDPVNAHDVLKRLQPLVDPEREEAFRILIVEDDRSQALFAEGVLRNAGMDSLVVTDALDVMPALKQFQPDLILMDLNMPGANGIELTALIREQEAFAHTPIVFLSGESSEDLQFDAIDAGGDDFLSKPIRPRHLISAVQTRVRRHRQQENRRSRHVDRDAATGLVYRKNLLERIDACLRRSDQSGGLVFLEVENLGLLRERIGLTALEIMLGDVSRLVATTVGDLPVTRFGDGSYLLLDTHRSEASLDSLATLIRQTVMQKPFQALGHPLRLRVAVGVCAFLHGFNEAGTMINAVEKVAREARTHDRGIRRFEPPRAAEALKEAALLAQVREALDQDSLVLLYQPVVAVAGNDVSQYQALLRVRDSSGKLRPAAEIIPIAERSNLIVDIDRWVMMQSITLIRERLAEDQPINLFVTQSPLTLSSPGQSDWLKTELAGSGTPGASLVIELRLEDVTLHAATVRQFCDSLVGIGVQFCLSQYKAGSAAESLVQQLPLSFVKLDRKYTTGSITPELRDELKTLINQAHASNLQVIGHGVEDAQAAATLWMSGIDFIQGNLVQQADQELTFDFNQAVL